MRSQSWEDPKQGRRLQGVQSAISAAEAAEPSLILGALRPDRCSYSYTWEKKSGDTLLQRGASNTWTPPGEQADPLLRLLRDQAVPIALDLWTHCGPVGGCDATIGMQGPMKPAGRRCAAGEGRNNIRPIWTRQGVPDNAVRFVAVTSDRQSTGNRWCQLPPLEGAAPISTPQAPAQSPGLFSCGTRPWPHEGKRRGRSLSRNDTPG
jgi:hypothetical protein